MGNVSKRQQPNQRAEKQPHATNGYLLQQQNPEGEVCFS